MMTTNTLPKLSKDGPEKAGETCLISQVINEGMYKADLTVFENGKAFFTSQNKSNYGIARW